MISFFEKVIKYCSYNKFFVIIYVYIYDYFFLFIMIMIVI